MSNIKNRQDGSAIGKRNNKYHPRGKLPTTAAANVNTEKILDALNEVDPERASEVLKNFYQEVSKIQNLLNFSMGAGAGESGSGANNPSRGIKFTLTDALTGACCILVKKYGYLSVINFFETVLGRSDYTDLHDEYKEIVRNALISLYITIIIYGEKKVPISIIPTIKYGDTVPSPLYTIAPDLYVRQYHYYDNDPYPGYIEWLGPDDDKIYTLRESTDYPFNTLAEHVYSEAEQGMAKELDPYIANPKILFTIQMLNDLIMKYCLLIDSIAQKATSGKNSRNRNGNLMQILGSILGSLVQKAQTDHIPPSVLDKGKMFDLISKEVEKQGNLNSVIKPAAKKAVEMAPTSMGDIASMLNNTGNISFIMGMLSNLKSLTGQQNLQNDMNNSDQNTQYLTSQANLIKENINSDIKVLLQILNQIKYVA